MLLSQNYLLLSVKPSPAIATFKIINKYIQNMLTSSYHSTHSHHAQRHVTPRGLLALDTGVPTAFSTSLWCSNSAFLSFRHLWIISNPNVICEKSDNPIMISRGMKYLFPGSPSNTARSWEMFAAISDASQSPRTMFCLSVKTFFEDPLLFGASGSYNHEKQC